MQAEEQKREKRKKLLKILGALTGVVLLIGCCSVGGLMFLGSEPTATPIHRPGNTPMLLPTCTLQPTETPPPTNTPQPTVDSTSRYREEMYSLLSQYVEAQEIVAELNQQASVDPYLFLDLSWVKDIGLALGQATAIGRKIRALDPPSAYREAHSCLVKVTEHYDTFVDLYLQGAKNLDADLIIQASEELELATGWMNKAAEAMPGN